MTSLGLYEKITNLPIAIPIYICVALILINKDKKQVIKYAGLIGLIFVPYLITLGKNFTQFHTSLGAENLGYSKNLFIVFENFYDFIFCQNYTLSILFAKKINVVYPLIACLIIGLTLFLSIFISAKIKYKYESLVILLIPVLSLLSYPFFESLYRPWHFYTLTSLMLIPITFLNSVKIDSHIYLKKLLILLILCLAIVNLNTTFRNI